MDPQNEGFCFLPDNVVEEILLRVPIKTLIRSKCVSKHWKSLILNPIFKSLRQKNRVRHLPTLLMLTPPPRCQLLTTFNFSGEVMDQWKLHIRGYPIQLLPSRSDQLNNLVCLFQTNRFFVCNPNTRQCIRLPYSSHMGDQDAGGFAYLPSRDEYVVVHLGWLGTCEYLTLSISSEDKLIYSNWKRVEANFSGFFDEQLGIFANGVFYWVIDGPEYFLYFDVEKEVFSRFNLPFEREWHAYYSILEMKGDVYIRNLKYQKSMELWKLNNDRITWSREFTISLIDIDSYHPSNMGPVYVNGDGELLIFTGKCLKYYNPENGTFRDAGIGEFPESLVWGNMILHPEYTLLLGN